MFSKNTQVLTLAAAFALAASVATAQAPGPGASEYAPGHSTTNIPPGQGGVKGTTWNPPGQLMREDRAGASAKASVKTSAKAKGKSGAKLSADAKLKAKGKL
jgi:hypothetical protein